MSSAISIDGERPVGPRSRKGARTRSRLLEAAKEIFEENGFLEARISDIAERAGLSHGSFYHYFESKEEIFREVAKEQENQLSSHCVVDSGLVDTSTDTTMRHRLEESVRRFLADYRDEAGIMGVIEQVSRYDEHVNAARMATQRHFAQRAEQSIRRLQAEGVADARVNPTMAADALGAMVARFAELWLVQGYRRYSFDDAVDQLTLLWANALGLNEEPATGRRRPATKPKK